MDAPASVIRLGQEEALEILAVADWHLSLPRAELTPEMVAQLDEVRVGEEEAFLAAVRLGRELTELRGRTDEEDFWQSCAEMCDGAERADLEFMMELAALEAMGP